MANEKKFFVDINLQGNALKDATIGSNSNMTKGGSFRFDGSRLEYYDGSNIQSVANLTDISAVTGGLIFQGPYNAVDNNPDIADGSALKGQFWVVETAGSFSGVSVQVGDSIIAKVDNAGAGIADWLILQGNVVIATESVDGIVKLATQTEVNTGTEGGAVVVTPATLQGKIDADITPEINNKLPLAGGTMTGAIDMGGNGIDMNGGKLHNVDTIYTENLDAKAGFTEIKVLKTLNADSHSITNLPAPTNGGDAANKTYVDDQDALKLSLTGGTMSGNIDMGGHNLSNAENITAANMETNYIRVNDVPNNPFDATNKSYVDTAASTAQTNAEAYADSLAPNYDPAGAAATAESNANTYTDTQIDAQTYGKKIDLVDWTGSAGNYSYTFASPLGTSFLTMSSLDSGTGEYVEVSYSISGSNVTVHVNNLPTDTLYVSLVKANWVA